MYRSNDLFLTLVRLAYFRVCASFFSAKQLLTVFVG